MSEGATKAAISSMSDAQLSDYAKKQQLFMSDAELAAILSPSNASGPEVVEPSQPTKFVQLGRLP